MDMLSGDGFTKAYAPATCDRSLALLKTMGQQGIAWRIMLEHAILLSMKCRK